MRRGRVCPTAGGNAGAVGTAEANVIKMKIASMESGNYAAVQIAQTLSSNHAKLVLEIVAGGGADQGGLINVLPSAAKEDSKNK